VKLNFLQTFVDASGKSTVLVKRSGFKLFIWDCTKLPAFPGFQMVILLAAKI